jgi:hypothetical protein
VATVRPVDLIDACQPPAANSFGDDGAKANALSDEFVSDQTPVAGDGSITVAAVEAASVDEAQVSDAPEDEPTQPAAIVADDGAQITDAADSGLSGPKITESIAEGAAPIRVAQAPVPEEIATPEILSGPPGSTDNDVNLNRFTRPVTDVPLDIRPSAGTMPPNLATQPIARPNPNEWSDCRDRPPIVLSWTPWTICFRPLYFEEINLERYGVSWGILQPAVSGAHFFGTVAALPYKMVVRRPRSCVCSNGFSRPTDPVPPGYSDCVWRWDAGLIEAAIVAGIVIALP